MSQVVDVVRQQGGITTRAAVIAATDRRAFDQAVASGALVRLTRGRYALPEVDLAVATAHGMRGVLSHVSAAIWHGWEVKVDDRIDVTLPTRRHAGSAAPRVRVHRSDLEPADVTRGIVTTAERTLVDCLRTLPFDQALTIADSALRKGIDPDLLERVAWRVRGRGRPQALRVVAAASSSAANPFESCLRAIALDVPGLNVRPQRLVVGTRTTVKPDLVDEELRIVLEADSFEWHGKRRQLARDARRYNALVVDGWLVLRFSYEDVMYRPDAVAAVLRSAVAAVHARCQVPPCPNCAA